MPCLIIFAINNCIKPRPWIELQMVLLKFLEKSSVLPHPNGPLSELVPSSSFATAKKEVKSLVVTPVDGTGVKQSRSNYSSRQKKFTFGSNETVTKQSVVVPFAYA